MVLTKTQLNMENEKKSIKDILKKPFLAIFKNDKKRKEDATTKTVQKAKPAEVTPVSVLLENFEKLEIEKKNKELNDDADELDNFTYKVISEDIKDGRSGRIDSDTSGDSGISVTDPEADNKDLAETFSNLKVDDKKKKLQTVFISRAPVTNKHKFVVTEQPYSRAARDLDGRQISQINARTFSGGQVIVNENPLITVSEAVDEDTPRVSSEKCVLNEALKVVDSNVEQFSKSTEDQSMVWQLALEFVREETQDDNVLSDFIQSIDTSPRVPDYAMFKNNNNPIEEFSTGIHFDELQPYYLLPNLETPENSIFPTPPRSENVPSPMSDYYFNHSSESTFSPGTSSPMYNSDYEKCQDIVALEEYPISVTENIGAESDDAEKPKARERVHSTTMTMKQYKDMQKEISNEFSKMECCSATRKPCREIFQKYLKNLKPEERRFLCQKIAGLEISDAYGILQHIIISLSKHEQEDHFQMVLFSLICEKVLALKRDMFTDDFGLNLLKSAVLRCPARPLLTRYLVQCVLSVARTETNQTELKSEKQCVFNEVDSIGDNLLIACARGGDKYAVVLSELVRDELPLFSIHHANTDGCTALHVASSLHSGKLPQSHTVHVLLEHGNADLWRGDIRGGDTALHVAVNSANCDLRLVMIMFRHVDRKFWKKLAHAPNRSSVTPLEYARSAIKSTTRQNYPIEVLEFLKKCR